MQLRESNIMQIVVITGSTRGIGFGLAQEFLKRDCAVVINGRSQNSVDKAVETLSKNYDSERFFGYACDVSNYEQIQGLWDAAIERFGKVDYWINNAGIDYLNLDFVDMPVDKYQAIININLLGTMHGSHVAVNGMKKQGSGQIFNMEGLGSNGRINNGYAAYGASKIALTYFTQTLQKELEGTSVAVILLSPGMVVTDLLTESFTSEEKFNRAKRIFNILADKVETVCPYLVEKILANQKNGAKIEWLSNRKIALRFLTAAFNKRDLFSGE